MDKPELNKIAANLIILRQYLPFMDFEGRRFSNSDFQNSSLLIGYSVGLIV